MSVRTAAALAMVAITAGASGLSNAASSNVAISTTILSATSISAAACGSADATPIAFHSSRSGVNQIYLTGTDGTGATRISNTTDADLTPAWSPDGSRLAFTSTRGGNMDIYVMDADGGDPVRLTSAPGSDVDPDWSADGSKIVFNSLRDGNFEIYAMNADGSAQTRVTNHPASDERPTWSPDGLSIVFDSDRSGNSDVYRMLADGTAIQQLTTDAAPDYRPEWSPDGTSMIFGSTRLGSLQIFRMAADGTGQAALTTGPSVNYYPAWSPDGMQIVFQSGRDGNGEIYRMEADGSQQVRLTFDAGDDSHPDWRPVASSAPSQFGLVLPGASAVTSADCTVTWGSTNDTSMLRMYQSDAGGVAMTAGPATGLVGWWPANGSLADLSSTGNAMTVVSGAPGFAAGKPEYGQALMLDGTSDGAAIPWRANYDLETYTIDLWFRTPAIEPGFANIVAQKGNVGVDRNFGLWFIGSTLTAGLAEGGTDTQVSTASAPYVDNQWHHMALVVDSGASPKTMSLYVDGTSRASTTFIGTVATPAAGIQVGHNPACGTFCNFEGQIDEVRLQNVARTSGEIRSYHAGQVADYASGVVTWSSGANMFGACLRSVSGGGVTGTWTTSPTCPASDGTHWNAVPATSASAGAKIAASPVSGTGNATASIRFGLRTALSQPPGTYVAPVTFEVLAPNV